MKTCLHFTTLRVLVLLLGLALSNVASATDELIYCARMTSSASTSVWDPPFWWIPAGSSDYSKSPFKSTAPGVPDSRQGSYSHTAWSLNPGTGFGLVCPGCSYAPGSVYAVAVTQPNYFIATNTIFGVCSTNCQIGGLSGGGGYATNTTAFQAAYSVNQWGFVCWLTNTAGVPNPEIELHYVSGGGGDDLRHCADCVKFTLVSTPGGLAPVRIIGIGGGSVAYNGGSGTRFVLLKSANLGTSLSGWQRVATNWVTSSSFAIPTLAEGSTFYAIASE